MHTEYKLYTVKKGDTLAKISERFYGSANFIDKIMEYNWLKNANAIFINQQLELPGIEEVKIKPVDTKIEVNSPNILVPVPNGLNEIISTFGNIREYITKTGELSPRWNIDKLTTITLPFPIKYAGNFKQNIIQITSNKKLSKTFFETFQEIKDSKLTSEVKSFGGCFNFRAKRSSNNFSTHSWGISVDLNPLSNGMGTKGDMSPKLVTIFCEHGFKWGGDWTGRGCDPMHFQYCTGY